MRVVAEGVVAASDKARGRRSCCFPNICVLPTGRWICGFRAGPDKTGLEQTAMLTWSDDQGRTWSPPTDPFVPPTLDGRLGRFRAAACTALGGSRVLVTLYWVDCSDPTRPFFNEQTEGLLDSRLFTSISEDGGQTWSALSTVDTTPYIQPTPITGPTVILPDGRWGCVFELNKYYDDPRPWHHGSVMTFSSNQGRTWGDAVMISQDPANRIFYWDQRASVLADGTVLDLFWTYDKGDAVYLNIHARASRDSGRTWGEIWDTGVPGQPAAAVSPADGRLVMVYVDRSGAPCLKARISKDGARSFDAKGELVVASPRLASQTWNKGTMQDAWAEMSHFSLGLPATASLPDGDVLVVYYNGPERDATDVCWSRLSAK